MEKNNINKNQLAKILSIPSMSIGRWVNGKVVDPSLSKLLNLSNFFEINIDDLVTQNLEAQDKLNNIFTEYKHIRYFEWNESLVLENNEFVKTVKIPTILNIGDTENLYSIAHSKEYYGIYPKNAILIFSNSKEIKSNDVILVKNPTIDSMLFIQYREDNKYRSILTYEKVDIEQYIIQGIMVNIILYDVFLNLTK